jgi:IS605 OrfB family transposase
MRSKTKIFTYQTRLKIHDDKAMILDACAARFNRVERKLYADTCAGKDPLKLKVSYQAKFGITARQYNSCRIQLQGKIEAYKACLRLRIEGTQERIAGLERTLAKLEKKKNKSESIHQKKRRLQALKRHLDSLINDRDSEKVRLCFGSRKLFHAQFNLKANDYTSHEAWKADWVRSRNSTFFLLGSKDETAGNQSCTATLQEDGSVKLRLRLPDALVESYGKYIEFDNVRFHNGHNAFVMALRDNLERNRLSKAKDKNYLEHGQAISYRFRRNVKGWYIFVSLEVPPILQVTSKALGAIGIDINADHLALSEVDRFGNPIDTMSIPLVTYGKSQHQAKALIGEASALAIAWAANKRKPIALEKLDFTRKKGSLKEIDNPKYARMLSSFSYQSILVTLQSRAYREGIEIMEVNPAFTSVIGRVKFARHYGLSIHQAAAVCIARRSQGVSEKLPRHLDKIPDGKGNYVALSPPVRKGRKHVWSQWSVVKKSLLAALEAQSRATRCRSTSPPKVACSDSVDSSVVGGNPTRESSIQRLD